MKARQSNATEKASDAETHEFRSIAGVFLYMGQAALLQASYTASKMQQRLGSLHVPDIVDVNYMIRELQNLSAVMLFLAVDDIEDMSIVSFSDASLAVLKDVYDQTGDYTGMKIVVSKQKFFYPILWTSQKQQKVCYSSFVAENLAAGDADDRGYHLMECIK